MRTPPKNLLNTPGFFHCKRCHCILRVQICIRRQKMIGNMLKNADGRFDVCKNCDQGARNWAGSGKLEMLPRAAENNWLEQIAS